jgi:Tfp pilus assembly protein PilF
VATTYFRRAWAHIALGDYARAAEEFRRGLELDAAFARSTFRLETLYRDNVLAKAAHLESLAHAALLRPDDAELLFLLGLFLHFDDQPARAERFFARAVELAGGEGGHARLFLKPVDGKPAASRPAEGAAPRMPAGVDI